MNGTEPSDTNIPNSDFQEFLEETYLNNAISVDEIERAVRGLKKNKASGLNKKANEYIKSTSSIFRPIYHKLFNIVLDTGILPDAWLIGVIKPIYKNKDNPDDPNSYRPITILSCMGKLLTAVLNKRLESFIDANKHNENQCGFRRVYSTCDYMYFVLSLIFKKHLIQSG